MQLLVKDNYKTIGAQADRNVERMGKYEYEDKCAAHAAKGQEGRKQLPKAPRPWWRKTDKINTRLAEYGPQVEIKDGKPIEVKPMTEAGVRYVMEGKTT